jgi:hypothetical protein
VERALNEYRAVRSQFGNWLEADFPKAVAVMGRMIAALDSYVRLGSGNPHAPIALATLAAAREEGGDEAGATEKKPSEEH